jgi:hypothetical protein
VSCLPVKSFERLASYDLRLLSSYISGQIDKKFILEDLDSTHLLLKKKFRDEIERKVEAWMDEVGLVLFTKN